MLRIDRVEQSTAGTNPSMSETTPPPNEQPVNAETSVPRFVVTAEGELYGEDTPENRELVRRIHACVNACDSFTTEELERGVVQDMRRVIGQVAPLLQQREQSATQTAPASPQPISVTARPA